MLQYTWAWEEILTREARNGEKNTQGTRFQRNYCQVGMKWVGKVPKGMGLKGVVLKRAYEYVFVTLWDSKLLMIASWNREAARNSSVDRPSEV